MFGISVLLYSLWTGGVKDGHGEAAINGGTHRLVGGIVGGLVYTLGWKAFGVQPTLPGVAVPAGVGVTSAYLHDLVEPAIHPDHRAFLHRIALNGLVAVSLRRVCADPAVAAGSKMLLAAIGFGCLSHPCLDAFTPKGLPII